MARILLDTCAVIDLITDPAALGSGGWDIINDPDNRLYTCVIIDWATEPQALDDGVWDIIDDPENRIYISAETVRELVVHYNTKSMLNKHWGTARCISSLTPFPTNRRTSSIERSGSPCVRRA